MYSEFCETRLSLHSFKLIGGYGFETSISKGGFSGYERRVIVNPIPLFRGQITGLVVDECEKNKFFNFFNARRGNLQGFRLHWWADDSTTKDPKYTNFGLSFTQGVTFPEIADGSTRSFQLCKKYVDGGKYTLKPLFKIVPASISVYINDSLDLNASVNLTTGVVTPSRALNSGETITHDCQFDLPVRFDIENLPSMFESISSPSGKQIYSFEDIPIKEVFYPLNLETITVPGTGSGSTPGSGGHTGSGGHHSFE